MLKMYELEYSKMLPKAKQEKNRRATRNLEGEVRRLVYHILNDFIESVELHKFCNRTSGTQRIRIYKITVWYSNKVVVESIRRVSTGIKTFKFQSKDDVKEAIVELRRIAENIGLEIEVKDNKEQALIEIFNTQLKKES